MSSLVNDIINFLDTDTSPAWYVQTDKCRGVGTGLSSIAPGNTDVADAILEYLKSGTFPPWYAGSAGLVPCFALMALPTVVSASSVAAAPASASAIPARGRAAAARRPAGGPAGGPGGAPIGPGVMLVDEDAYYIDIEQTGEPQTYEQLLKRTYRKEENDPIYNKVISEVLSKLGVPINSLTTTNDYVDGLNKFLDTEGVKMSPEYKYNPLLRIFESQNLLQRLEKGLLTKAAQN